MTGTRRADIRPGMRVSIVLKADQRTGRLTEGVVATLLTKSPTHPHGIKVRLADGRVGRVKAVHPARDSGEPKRSGANPADGESPEG